MGGVIILSFRLKRGIFKTALIIFSVICVMTMFQLKVYAQSEDTQSLYESEETNSSIIENIENHEEDLTYFAFQNAKILAGELILNSGDIEEIDGSEYLGEMTITAYCGCRSCNGRWYGSPAKNGEALEEEWTVAVDPNVIPINSYIYIEGVGIRKAQDTGSAIKGNKIDLYFGSHSDTGDWGTRGRRVWVIKQSAYYEQF